MKPKYILYARKSSEDKNRQVTSIEDQIIELKRLAERQSLEILEVITESKSAKAPGREGFERMLKLIQKGKAEGILCWKLDRLARNPIDHGKIAWMLQKEIIKKIYTHSNEYRPSDNVLMMQVEFGMATQYVKDLNVNVSRGTRLKAERGWSPSPVLPVGYMHNPLYLGGKSNIEIVPDSNFEIAEKLWKLLLTGKYTVAELKYEGDLLGLKAKNGQEYSRNTYYLMFKKTFYAGFFHWKDEKGNQKLYTGKHKTMITYEQFEQAQYFLDGKNTSQTRLREHYFPYRGLMHCGECKGYITAEYIHQVICTNCKHKYSVKSNPECRKCSLDFHEMLNPTEIIKKYYRCIKKPYRVCNQKSIEEYALDQMILEMIGDMEFDKDFYQWGLDQIEEKYIQYVIEKGSDDELKKEEKELNIELNGYSKMRATGELSKERFLNLSEPLERRIMKINHEIRKDKNTKIVIKEMAKSNLQKALNLKKSFKDAPLREKNKILKEIGYNLILIDKKAYFITPKWLSYLQTCATKYYSKLEGFQPKTNPLNIRDSGHFTDLNLTLLADYDVNRT